jgi:hypothetical protein
MYFISFHSSNSQQLITPISTEAAQKSEKCTNMVKESHRKKITQHCTSEQQ